MYNELIQKIIDALKKENSNDIRKYNILGVLNNEDVPKKTMSERSITERTKLRKERVDEIKRKEQNINNELFREYFTNYHSPSVMYGKLRETKGAVNELRVNLIKDVLT